MTDLVEGQYVAIHTCANWPLPTRKKPVFLESTLKTLTETIFTTHDYSGFLFLKNDHGYTLYSAGDHENLVYSLDREDAQKTKANLEYRHDKIRIEDHLLAYAKDSIYITDTKAAFKILKKLDKLIYR